jgi:hypothetical protein
VLIEFFRGLWFILFEARVKRTFSALLVFMLWFVFAIALFVTIPHSYEVIIKSEHGDLAAPKSLALAIIVELTAAVFFLLTLHSKEISSLEQKIVLGMTVPYILITARLQLSYFYPKVDWIQITPFELGLILPYVITSVTVCIGIMYPYTNHTGDNSHQIRRGIIFFGIKIWQAVEITEYEAEINRLKDELAACTIPAPDEEKEKLRAELNEAEERLTALSAPDPYRELLTKELEKLREDLTITKSSRVEALATVVSLREEADNLHAEVHELREKAEKLPEIKLIYQPVTFPKEAVTKLVGRLYSNKNRLNSEEFLGELEKVWTCEETKELENYE